MHYVFFSNLTTSYCLKSVCMNNSNQEHYTVSDTTVYLYIVCYIYIIMYMDYRLSLATKVDTM